MRIELTEEERNLLQKVSNKDKSIENCVVCKQEDESKVFDLFCSKCVYLQVCDAAPSYLYLKKKKAEKK